MRYFFKSISSFKITYLQQDIMYLQRNIMLFQRN